MTKRYKMEALANAKVFDPITYNEFLQGLGNTPLNQIKKKYGEEVAEDTRKYFIKHPSARFLWIQNGCHGPEPKVTTQ